MTEEQKTKLNDLNFRLGALTLKTQGIARTGWSSRDTADILVETSRLMLDQAQLLNEIAKGK
jgi:hypothetical protein